MNFPDENNLSEISKNAQKFEDKKVQDTFLYLVPDTENEFEEVFEIKDPQDFKIKEQWMDIMAEAAAEYYRNSSVYDDSPDEISTIDLILHAIAVNNIPLVRYWKPAKVDKINTIWLAQQYFKNK